MEHPHIIPQLAPEVARALVTGAIDKARDDEARWGGPAPEAMPRTALV